LFFAGAFCSSEQEWDIQVEMPSLGRIHHWRATQATIPTMIQAMTMALL